MALKRRAASREGMVIMSVALPRDLHRELAIAALDEHAASNELIRLAIREFLKRRKGRGSKSHE